MYIIHLCLNVNVIPVESGIMVVIFFALKNIGGFVNMQEYATFQHMMISGNISLSNTQRFYVLHIIYVVCLVNRN